MIKFENIRLFSGEQVFEHGCVLVDGRNIAYAGGAALCPDAPGAEVIDGKRGILMPGLFNAHTHAAMTLVRGVGSDASLMDWLGQIMPYEARFTPEAVYWGTQLAMLEMIRRGTVGYADMYFHMEKVAEAAADSGMKACLTRGCSDEQGIESVVRLHRDWHGAGEGRIRVQMGVHAEYTTTPELVRIAVREAEKMGTGFHTHIAESASETQGCLQRHGVTPARYFHDLGALQLGTIAAHCVHMTEEDMALMEACGAFPVHNPVSNMKLASGFSPVQPMLDRGISVALGNDGVSSNNALDLFQEMKTASLIQKGHTGDPTALNAFDTIRMATRHGALAMGFKDSGLLKSGMAADLILLDGEAENLLPGNDLAADIVFSAQGLNVALTMVDGKILYRDGTFHSLDQQRIKARFMEQIELLGIQ